MPVAMLMRLAGIALLPVGAGSAIWLGLSWCQDVNAGHAVQMLVAAVGFGGLCLAFPWWALKWLPTKRLSETPAVVELGPYLEDVGLVADQLRVLDTQGRLANAWRLGTFSTHGSILISDGLLERVAPQQVVAILLHERAHETRQHGLIRLSLFSGLISIAILTHLVVASVTSVETVSQVLGLTTVELGVFALLTWLAQLGAHALEFDADLQALKDLAGNADRLPPESLASCLTQLSGQNYSTSTLLHPSVRHRCERLAATRASQDKILMLQTQSIQTLAMVLGMLLLGQALGLSWIFRPF